MIEFNIFKPTPIGEIFNIAADESSWEQPEKYVRKGSIWVPNRPKTLSLSQILEPKNEKVSKFFDKRSKSNYGIYIMFFSDQKVFYAGIAARHSYKKNNQIIKIKSPEGILKRLKKHRLKCTGTNVWFINHTNTRNKGWRDFALKRYKYYKKNKKHDVLQDCFLSIINFSNPEKFLYDDKGILETLENDINTRYDILQLFGSPYSAYSAFGHSNPNRVSLDWRFNFLSFPF